MIYLLMECSGDYDDYREVPILASADNEKLEQRIVELKAQNEEHNQVMDLLTKFRRDWIKENPRPGFKPVGRNALPQTLENIAYNEHINEEFYTKKKNDEATFLKTLKLSVDGVRFLEVYYRKEFDYNIEEVETI